MADKKEKPSPKLHKDSNRQRPRKSDGPQVPKSPAPVRLHRPKPVENPLTRIYLNEQREALVPDSYYHHAGHPKREPAMTDRLGDVLGEHEFCKSELRYLQVSPYGGVIACQGGCNLRVHVKWPLKDYTALLLDLNE
ncbi:MAG: hypothetical protein NUV56_00880, partial [Candidatus Uhrbacteria bacterium]|nr:hypothetical protein [Candidatus Uhrbacteria bacterium]